MVTIGKLNVLTKLCRGKYSYCFPALSVIAHVHMGKSPQKTMKMEWLFVALLFEKLHSVKVKLMACQGCHPSFTL